MIRPRKRKASPKRKNATYIRTGLFLLITLFTAGCGIYGGGFQRGGELTSDLLERIEENEEGEDQIVSKKEKLRCLRPSQK